MTTLEIILLVGGILFIVISFVMSDAFSGRKEDAKPLAAPVDAELTKAQKEKLQAQLDELVRNAVTDATEKTEISLDKISNTKILEMSEYAENILGQINKNHDETVFLYDMLNEKAKEVKTAVKDVNVTRRQVEKIQAEVSKETKEVVSAEEKVVTVSQEDDAQSYDGMPEPAPAASKPSVKKPQAAAPKAEEPAPERPKRSNLRTDNPKKPPVSKSSRLKVPKEVVSYDSGNAAKERTKNVVERDDEERNRNAVTEEDRMDAAIREMNSGSAQPKKTKPKQTKRTRKTVQEPAEKHEEVADMNIQFEAGSNNNEKILALYRAGKTNKDIAKELGLGIGEVKLVIDLYNSTK